MVSSEYYTITISNYHKDIMVLARVSALGLRLVKTFEFNKITLQKFIRNLIYDINVRIEVGLFNQKDI